MQRLEIPRPTQLGVLRALFGWGGRGAWLFILVLFDILRGLHNEERTAEHAYRVLVKMDPVARKIAQLFAYRFDLLPIPTAMILARLDDVIPPLSTETTIDVVQRALGVPLDSVFRVFDPVALGSRVLRCTYQGVIRDGSEVVVRIRPPGMRQRLLDQLTALGWLLAVLEMLTIVRPGFFRHLKTENASLLMEEADFRQQARSQRLFEQRTRRDKLNFVTVAPLHEGWVRDNLVIASKVEGLWLSEVIAVVEENSPRELYRLRAQGIDPGKLGRQLLQLAWWEQIEHLFFQASPIPADVVVAPGGRMAMVHFTTTAATTSRHRNLLIDLYQRVAVEDASGVAEVLIQFLTPMPFIDTHSFFKRVEALVWYQLLAMHDEQARWWERTSVGLWAALLTTAREQGVQVHLEIIHLMRSSMMFEAMAFRLNPELDLVKEFRRYRRRSDVRTARRISADFQRAIGQNPRAAFVARMSEAASLAQRVGFFLEMQLENLPITNLAMPRKAAYTASVVLNTAAICLLAAAVESTVRIAVAAVRRRDIDWTQAFSDVLHNPFYIGFVTVLSVIGLRRLLFRLGDKDPNG